MKWNVLIKLYGQSGYRTRDVQHDESLVVTLQQNQMIHELPQSIN